jgi:hypothetical protein
MEPTLVFGAQFVGSLVAWSVVAACWVAEAVRGWSFEDRLALTTTPLMLRFLGLGLLVDQLSPGLDVAFARNTAIGDSVTALLAVLATIGLRRRWSWGRTLAWGAHLVGAIDLAIALPSAARVGAALHMHAQWYVPAFGVPLMIVAHVLGLRLLLGSRENTR